LNVPAQVPVGQDVSFSVTFDNPDLAAPGYGPILDITLDTTGADAGASGGPFDGLGTTSISASYLGIPFSTAGPNPTMWILTFDALGEATHPLMRNANCFPLSAVLPATRLLRMPLDFTPGQPPATVNMT
jgi:hypothetical protein